MPAEQEHPVRPGVQAREGDVARADHQRQQVVRQAGPHRDDDEEDHRRPVHGEELVVLLGREQRVLRRAELEPHQQRLDAAEQEEDGDGPEVQDPDLLVVGRRDPRRPALGSGRTPWRDDLRAGRAAGGVVERGHQVLVLGSVLCGGAGAAAGAGRRVGPSCCSSCLRPAAAASFAACDVGRLAGRTTPSTPRTAARRRSRTCWRGCARTARRTGRGSGPARRP